MPVLVLKKETEIDLEEELEDDKEEGEEEGEVEKNNSKQMEIQMPVSALNKTIRVGDGHNFVGTYYFLNKIASHSLPLPSSMLLEQFLILSDVYKIAPEIDTTDSLFHRALGVNNCHQLLFNAQESLYLKEIFENVFTFWCYFHFISCTILIFNRFRKLQLLIKNHKFNKVKMRYFLKQCLRTCLRSK
jgi:hypothetical protein